MRPLRVAIVIGLFAIAAVAVPSRSAPSDPYAEHIASQPPRTPEEERKGFHVPSGFEVQLVAAEPDVRKPINMNFDARGRLWVTESVEYPFPSNAGNSARDTIRIYEINPESGRATHVMTFTSGLNIPIGVLPVRGGALAYSIPNISLIHGDGHDHAIGRDPLYATYGHRDTHGMTGEFTLGFDGWIYACHGYSNTSEVKGGDGQRIVMQSGNTYRFRPDGLHLEYFTHGQVNPFGLTFDPLGNLYSCDCHSRPIYQLLRGAYYPSFGKPHDGLGFGPEVMTHDHGSTAIAGITYYAADHFPPEYRDTVFIGNVVTNRINHDRLELHGSTPMAILQPDFLSSDDPWFRPVDIKLGPDGALYVADFYNRIIGHYEVPLTHPGRDRERGRIWRIVYRGSDGKQPLPRAPRTDWNKASIAELVHDLANPNLTVRFLAANQLVERGGLDGAEAVRKIMTSESNPFQRMHGLWVLDRQGLLDDAVLARAADDIEPGVRIHAMRVLAERTSLNDALQRLAREGLRDIEPRVQRAAANALGRHPNPTNVRPLLDLRRQIRGDDTHLLHMVRMALRDQLQAPDSFAKLPKASWTESDARAIADVATGVPTRASAQYLLAHLEKYRENSDNRLRYVYHVARFGSDAMEDELLGVVRKDAAAKLRDRLTLFQAIQKGSQARGSKLRPEARAWGEELTNELLASRNKGEIVSGIELAGALKLASAHDKLVRVMHDAKAPESQRTACMSALMSMDAARIVPLVAEVLRDAKAPMALRERSAHLLAGSNRADALKELTQALTTAPQRLAVVIAVGLATSRNGAARLLDTVEAGKASAQLLKDRVVGLRLDKSSLPGVRERIVKLTQNLPSPEARFQKIFDQRRQGFEKAVKHADLGAKVFEKNCMTCHIIANKGAKIGPQLDGIGIRGLDRLMEDILDPNRNVDQAFRLTTLDLNNGQIVSGLMLREEGEVYVLADSQGKEVRVRKGDVAERTLSQLSPMPANFMDQIPEAEFYDLLAYLLTQQQPKDPRTK